MVSMLPWFNERKGSVKSSHVCTFQSQIVIWCLKMKVVWVAHNKTESELSEIRLHFNIGIKLEKWGLLCWSKQNEQNLKKINIIARLLLCYKLVNGGRFALKVSLCFSYMCYCFYCEMSCGCRPPGTKNVIYPLVITWRNYTVK